jgi:hypothetical protein
MEDLYDQAIGNPMVVVDVVSTCIFWKKFQFGQDIEKKNYLISLGIQKNVALRNIF